MTASLVWFAAALALGAGGNGAEPTHIRLQAPRLLPALPERPFVDLGPVRIPKGTREELVAPALLAMADRLGADGWVVEVVPLEVAYGAVPDPYRSAVLALERRVPAGDRPLVADPPDAAFIFSTQPPPPKPGHPLPHDVVYRLVRLDGSAPARPVPAVAGAADPVRELLSQPSQLRDQLLLLHFLRVRALVSSTAYEALRSGLCSSAPQG